MKGLGIALIMLGVIIYIIANGSDVTAGRWSDTINLHKLQIQLVLFQSGIGLAIMGTLLYGAGRIVDRLEALRVTNIADRPVAAAQSAGEGTSVGDPSSKKGPPWQIQLKIRSSFTTGQRPTGGRSR